MNYDRKSFLQRAVWGSVALAGGALARADVAGKPPPLPEYAPERSEEFWAAVRRLFVFAPDLAYFNTGGLGPAAGPVLDLVAETTRRLQSESEHGHERFEELRREAARYLGADATEVAFVRNATEGNAIVASGVRLAPGDEVVFDSHAHPGGSFGWFNQARLRGVVVRLFEPDPRDPAENLRRIEALLSPRTKLVQVSHVTAPTGIVLPVPEIARRCRTRGIWFHVDGAQSAGMFPFAVRDLGCDSFATSGHKWIGGPLETGLLVVRQARQDDLVPVHVGAYSGQLDYLPGEFRLTGSAIRYEYGTRNVAAATGLIAAMRLQEQIGRERIGARGRELAARLRAGLARIPGVEILTPDVPALSASMLTFRAAAMPYDRLFERLFKTHRMRCRPVSEQKLNAVRVSLHLFNSPAEVDALAARTAELLAKA